jgi:uncharacterized membrane protein HdeD (DUF308 family)
MAIHTDSIVSFVNARLGSNIYVGKQAGCFMSTSSSKSSNFGSDVKSRAGWGIVLGILTAILGVVLIAHPLWAAPVTTNLIGSILIMAGFSELGQALRAHIVGAFFSRVLLGLVYGFAGIVLILSPRWGGAVLTGVLGVMLLVEAGATTVLAFQVKPAAGWYLFDAVITAILGILILIHWPVSSLRAIGTLVGVAVLVRRITRIALSKRLHNVTKRVEEIRDRPKRAA